MKQFIPKLAAESRLYLKHQPVLDIFSISFGFVLRVYSGALIIDVTLSHWMFITTLSLALLLASIKRKKELDNVGTKARKSLSKYNEEILNKYIDMSAMSTIVFYSMFTLTQKTELIATTPLVLLGVYRYIYTTSIKNIESPTEVLYADHTLKIIVTLWLFLNILIEMI